MSHSLGASIFSFAGDGYQAFSVAFGRFADRGILSPVATEKGQFVNYYVHEIW